MTLDEAIKHAEGIAIEQENFYNPDGYECITKSHQKCAAEHRQLAEWLKDYKRMKEQEPKTGEWIGDAKTYYEELNKRGLGVDEYTPYFTDDIACSECLAKYSILDNETQFFKYCPNCGCRMVEPQESEEINADSN